MVERLKMKKTTIKDVAREAGVAVSTVSNALNGSSLVTEETRAKVAEAAKKLNYVPNMNGRFLKSGRSKTLCFITSSIRGEYFCRLLDAVNEECVQKGYGLDIVVTWDRGVMMNHIVGGRFDGFFLFEGERIREKELEQLKREHITAVMLDRKYEEQRIGCVVFDSYRAGHEVTKYLINLGHKRICFVDSAADIYDCVERKRGYSDALLEAGIELGEHYIIQGYFDENVTYSAVLAQAKLHREDFPTAFVCGNDQSAMGAVKALKLLGYRVPEEVSVTGFDDIEVAGYFEPHLSTVRNPIEEQGKNAVGLMLEMLDGGRKGRSIVLPGVLVPRNSSGIACNDTLGYTPKRNSTLSQA